MVVHVYRLASARPGGVERTFGLEEGPISELHGLRGPRDSVGWDTNDGKRGSGGVITRKARNIPSREISSPFPHPTPPFFAKAQLRHS